MTHPLFAAVKDDFAAVDDLIRRNLNSDVPLVEEISRYLVNAGGKRLRPLLVLVSALSAGYGGQEHIRLAAVIEFLHTAMLLHDDVVDASARRRGYKTVNAEWGNPASVLVGDFLHSRAFEMMVEIGDIRVMKILSRATNIIAEGEVMQLSHLGDTETSEAEYMEIISRKTAMLFEAASHSAAVLSRAPDRVEEALRAFGQHLGMAFQLIDDELDYTGDASSLGKNIGDDLAEGKVTLPLIIAMRHGSNDQRCFVRECIRRKGTGDIRKLKQLLTLNGGLAYTRRAAVAEQQKAFQSLSCIENSAYKEALAKLAVFAVGRSH